MEKFQLEQEDYQVLKFSRKYIQKVLKQFDLTPKQIIGIGNYLFALDRLPLKTQGVDCYIQLSNRTVTNNETWEMKSYGFTLNEEIFHIEVGGWVEGPNGGDSVGYPGWYVEADGGRETDAEVWKLEDELSLIIHLGAEIKVEDSSKIDFDEIEEDD
jgi:hypothetical protein